MSTDAFQAAGMHDLWLRFVIAFFASVSALGTGLAWRNLAKTSELQAFIMKHLDSGEAWKDPFTLKHE